MRKIVTILPMHQVLVKHVQILVASRRRENYRCAKLEGILANVLLYEVEVLLEYLPFVAVEQHVRLLNHNHNGNS